MPFTEGRIPILTTRKKKGRGINPTIKRVVTACTMAFNLRAQAMVFKQALEKTFRRKSIRGHADYSQPQEKVEAYRCSVTWGKQAGRLSFVHAMST
jgi:hypothetical protein